MARSLNQWQTKLQSLTKKANQRIVQLSKAGYAQSSSAYKRVMEKAFTLNQKQWMFSTSKSGNPKFRTDILKLSKYEQQALYYEIQKFLKNEESTVSGYKKEQKRRFEKARKTYEKQGFKFSEGDYLKMALIFADPRVKDLIKRGVYDSEEVRYYSSKAIGRGEGIEEIINKLMQQDFEWLLFGHDVDYDENEFMEN